MKPDKIGKAYDQITHLWQSSDFNRNNGIEAHQRALTFAKNKGKALDIGCGCTGRFIDLLQGEGFEAKGITGIDVSEHMLSIVSQRYPDITFVHADICEYQIDDTYDFITAWDSIWHIPLEEQRQVITKIIDSLNCGGVFIFSFGGTEEEGGHTDDFMGPEVYYSTLGTNGFLNLFIELGCIIRHLEFDQYPELHTYLIVEKRSVQK
ncbi:class I SAM-dependent methyltransferase [Photobacterium sp. DNB23_23_1]|uniref:Class I SAM-dependent methyltransferase n=1 Tax=Photobacterium pectinilyticum TaxID=2906793 RepID=A0ABT1N9I5_9GAMM|nr:class I SAM-dependent methyltransferase [Photobacterium sp. ZSDE20]MCQ1060509.1 class I SAM-dependent methyltransferase [Photobacterium sp. ZSDE20]MDD1827895.1 class I SAM-dependent methyltransferase [Photobacterium sp. ZSDE20]